MKGNSFLSVYRKLKRDYRDKNELYDKTMAEYEKLVYTYDPTQSKEIFSRALDLITIGSAGYDPETALLPNFSNIPIDNRNQFTSGSYSGAIAGTTFVLGFGGLSWPTFITKAMRVDQGSTFSKAIYIYETNSVINTTQLDYSNQDPNGSDTSYWSAAFGFPSKAIIWSNSNPNIRRYNAGVVSTQVTAPLFLYTSYYTFVYDGYRIWIGVSTTTNDPVFTWYKVGDPAVLFDNATYIAFRFGFYRSSYYSNSGYIASYSATVLTGSLPWN